MGRSSELGWLNVSNDAEGALRNSPTRTRHNYYWRLTQDFDLSELTDPTLELKYLFKGHNYSYFQVLIGDEGAQKKSDFAVLHEVNEANTVPEEVNIDLSAYAGHRVRIQLVLHKPHDVVERRVGIYIHRAAIVTPSTPFDLDDRSDELRVVSFNVQAFGLSKMAHPDVSNILLQVISLFDLVLIQEVRDMSETAVADLLAEINSFSAEPYALLLSDRLGRNFPKEQVAFLYRIDKLSLVESGVMSDPDALFERSPAWARFEHIESEERVWMLSVHLEPRNMPGEIAALYEIFEQYQRETPASESAIIMGDFKAGCRHLSDDEIALTSLFNTSSLTSLIGHDEDTTTTSTFCPYDRIFVNGPWVNRVAESGVYRFDQILGLSGEQTRAVSDHYPVWARFQFSGAE